MQLVMVQQWPRSITHIIVQPIILKILHVLSGHCICQYMSSIHRNRDQSYIGHRDLGETTVSHASKTGSDQKRTHNSEKHHRVSTAHLKSASHPNPISSPDKPYHITEPPPHPLLQFIQAAVQHIA